MAGSFFHGPALPCRAIKPGAAEEVHVLDVACPPTLFNRSDRRWLEEALVPAGLDVRSPSARG